MDYCIYFEQNERRISFKPTKLLTLEKTDKTLSTVTENSTDFSLIK